MNQDESRYPADWLRIAELDLVRVSRNLRDEDPIAAGFFLQQALEKFIKGFLLKHGWNLRRIHDLEDLLEEAFTYDGTLAQFMPLCRRVTSYYVLDRYRFLSDSGPSQEEVEEQVAEAKRLIERLR